MPIRPVLLYAALALLAIGPVAGGEARADPGRFVTGLGERTSGILSRPGLTGDEAVAAFRTLLREDFDIPGMGRFALGRHWNAADEDQRRRFLDLFEEVFVQTYAGRFTEFGDRSIAVTGTRPEGEREVVVDSAVVGGGAPPITVTWRVRNAAPESGSQYRVVDVTVMGLSMRTVQRAAFSILLQRHDGDFDGLLGAMQALVRTAHGKS